MRATAVLVAAVWLTAAVAGPTPTADFDAGILPSAFGGRPADEAAIRARLAPVMTVLTRDGWVVAARGTPESVSVRAARIAALDRMLRRRVFPESGAQPLAVAMADDDGALLALVAALYPGVPGERIPAGGFYHPTDRLILATSSDGALLRELTRAHLRQVNPEAPLWLEQAAVELFASSEVRGDRLMPVLDHRMAHIPADEDLSYDVFAGICDCSQVSDEQIALMRLLLVFLDDRGQVPALLATVGRLGRYTTLLQALDAMDFDGKAWKAFADGAVGGQWQR